MNNSKSLYVKNNSRKNIDNIMYTIICIASAITIGILISIIGFIFIKGLPSVNLHFLTSEYNDVTKYIQVAANENYDTNRLGVELELVNYEGENFYEVKSIDNNSPVLSATINEVSKDQKSIIEKSYKVKVGEIIQGVGSISFDKMTLEEVYTTINETSGSTIRVKVIERGGGIVPMLVTTLMMIGISLLIAGPIGIFAAIYLVEYAKPGRLVNMIRFATESLSGIPSIIYGLFGMLFFVSTLNFGYSIISGAMTISIILLPVIIRQTEESLKSVPMNYREASLGLGVSKIQTIQKVVLPSAIPGIVVAIILSVGRVVGESAALYLTAGTAARIPTTFFESGATLTVKAYQVAKEEGNIEMACAIGTIIVVVVVAINLLSKYISKKFMNQHI